MNFSRKPLKLPAPPRAEVRPYPPRQVRERDLASTVDSYIPNPALKQKPRRRSAR